MSRRVDRGTPAGRNRLGVFGMWLPGVGLLAVAALIWSCGDVSGLRSSLEWLAEINRHEGALVRAYGDDGNDEFVAIVEPTSNVMQEGYLAIGHSDSWGQGYPGLWIVAIDLHGTPQSQFYFDNNDGVVIVDAARSSTGRDGPDTLLATGNLVLNEGNLAVVVIPLDDMVALGSEAPAARFEAFAIDATTELEAADLLYFDPDEPVIVGSSDGHPMIMKLNLESTVPTVVWQMSLTDLDGKFTSCIREPGGDLIASGTSEESGDTNALVCRFSSDTGVPIWLLDIGNSSDKEEGGALLWMSFSGENLVLVGSSADYYPNGWVFHAISAEGGLRKSTFVDIVVVDDDPNPPIAAVERWPTADEGFGMFLGTEATVMEMRRSDDPFRAARRDPSLSDVEFQPDYVNPVTIAGSWRGLVHAGSMASIEYLLSNNNDGMLLWPLEGDGASYPANKFALVSTLDVTPDPLPAKAVPAATALDAVVTELTGWDLLQDTWPVVAEY